MTGPLPTTPAATPLAPSQQLWRNPWFTNLFVAELWERVGFYGIQAILVLYAVAPTDNGGMGLSSGSAAALFGAYLGVTFMLALPGGWIADRVLGQQRALVVGLAFIAAGCLSLAVSGPVFAIIGLLCIACGFGLFKPNHQALINMLAGPAGRREATIAAFFVGIQGTALVAPLVIGFLGERVSWRVGFATLGIVVGIGVVTTARGLRSYGRAGAGPARPLAPSQGRRVARRVGLLVAAVVVLVVVGLIGGFLNPQIALMVVGLTLISAPWGAYVKLRRDPGLTADDRWRLSIMLRLVLAATIFWLLAGQDGSVLTLFAKDSTDRTVLGFTFPASWLQAATPLFMLVLAPLFAWQLPRLGARYSVPMKFAFALVVVAVSFLVMAVAAGAAADGTKVSPLWLLAVYLMHACAEIVIAAVSISSMADLVPSAYLGQGLGLYWLFAALGGGLASQVSALVDVLPGPVYFVSLAVVALAVAAAFVAGRRGLAAPFATARGAGEPADGTPY
ncbi:peptide MFS transporter [Asanoa iriomotensis]|nr:oligopeptide:H+ symporter [Asanoa iriomotensis]